MAHSLNIELTAETNKVLRNTYQLLSMTVLFSAFTAWLSMDAGIHINIFVTLIGYFGLLFLTEKFKNSSLGILFVFMLTGFMGVTIGPILNMYLQNFSNGAELIMTALGGTGVIFFGLSAYVMSTKKDFSFLGGFLVVGALVGFLASIGAMVFNIPALSLGVSAMFVLISSGFILYETSQIINGGERNYISATVSLYVSLFNLFMSLLRLLAAFSGSRD